MIAAARIREDLQPAGLDWITSLRAPQIQALAERGPLQLSLLDERNLAEITAPDYPGERLIVCRNPDLAKERARKRDELLAATERDLSRIVAHVRRRYAPLRGKAEIGLAVGAVIDRHKMGKHHELTITVTASPMAASPRASHVRRGSTDFTSSAPACQPRRSVQTKLCVPIRTSRAWSRRSNP